MHPAHAISMCHNSPPDPADATLVVLSKMRELNSRARAPFESFVAAQIAFHLVMVGSEFTADDVRLALLAFEKRSPGLFAGSHDPSAKLRRPRGRRGRRS